MTDLFLTLLSSPFMLSMNQKRRKKKSQCLRAQNLAIRYDKGALTDGADFGVEIFPKVQIITLESVYDG